MLSPEENLRLCRVGPGTPMGELLRRYWHPIAAVAELSADEPTRAVRLLGEDLVVYRTQSGRHGLVEARCPHRGASLRYAIVEQDTIRCSYHGWRFTVGGECIERPCERGAGAVRARSYEVAPLGGLLWAYLGPSPAPPLPRWDFLVEGGCARQLRVADVPCNWLQIMENALDPVHLEWLHGHYLNHLAERYGVPPLVEVKRHEAIAFERTPFGLVKRRRLAGQDDAHEDWTVGRELLFPLAFRTAGPERFLVQLRVPVDDTHTRHFWYHGVTHARSGAPPDDLEVPVEPVELVDARGEYRLDTLDGQDAMAWVTQGPIADRSREHLGAIDRGIVLYRRLLREQLERVAAGEAPEFLIPRERGHETLVLPRRTAAAARVFARLPEPR